MGLCNFRSLKMVNDVKVSVAILVSSILEFLGSKPLVPRDSGI